jgi:hypothetical protein
MYTPFWSENMKGRDHSKRSSGRWKGIKIDLTKIG